MSVSITIHRGASEIGGTCLEINSNGNKVLIDAGLPLTSNAPVVDIKSIKPTAIVISHPHMDHYGMTEEIWGQVPIYIGETGLRLINAARTFCGKKPFPMTGPFIQPNKVFSIGELIFRPYLMDHSAVDAYAFQIVTPSGNIFYSGDFRGHGRKRCLLDRLVKNPPQKVDLLFLEGTMLGRKNEAVATEKEIASQIIEVVKHQKNSSFLISSAQNIDRIVSAYIACLKTNKTLVIDIYTAWVLENIKNLSCRVPTIDWKLIKVLFFGKHSNTLFNGSFPSKFKDKICKKRILPKEIKSGPDKYLIQLSAGLAHIVNGYKSEINKPNLIYSQWRGYLEKEDYKDQYWKLRKLINEDVVNLHYVHTSGHATVEDLKRLVTAIKPKRVIPIHTEYPKEFSGLFKNAPAAHNGQVIHLDRSEGKI